MRHHVFDARPSDTGAAADAAFVKSDYPAGLRMPRHFDLETRVTLVLAGGCTETVGRRENYCGPGSVVLKPAGADHSNVFGDRGMTVFSIRFPSDAPAAPEAHRWAHGGPIARCVLDVYQQVVTRDGAAGERVDADVLDVLAMLTGAPPDHRAGHMPPWLDEIRDALHDTYRKRINVRDLAAMVATHPVYLARVFRRRFGCSVMTYVHRLRAHRAADLLGASNEPPAQIAVRVGFADQAHLCRVFKAQTGVTPAAYRRLIRGA